MNVLLYGYLALGLGTTAFCASGHFWDIWQIQTEERAVGEELSRASRKRLTIIIISLFLTTLMAGICWPLYWGMLGLAWWMRSLWDDPEV